MVPEFWVIMLGDYEWACCGSSMFHHGIIIIDLLELEGNSQFAEI